MLVSSTIEVFSRPRDDFVKPELIELIYVKVGDDIADDFFIYAVCEAACVRFSSVRAVRAV